MTHFISNCCSSSFQSELYNGYGRCSSCGEIADVILDEEYVEETEWMAMIDSDGMACFGPSGVYE